MASTPIKRITKAVEGRSSQELLFNDEALKNSVCGGTVYVQDFDRVATPTGLGTADEGKVYKVAAVPTGDWLGLGFANMLAIWTGSGWGAMDPAGASPRGAFHVIVASGATAHAKEWWAYSPVENEWHPLQLISSAAEYWTGRYSGSSKVYSKTISFGALPNNTVKNVAHGVSGMILSGGVGPTMEGSYSDGTSCFPMHGVVPAGISVSWLVNATNVSCTTNFNATTFSSNNIRLEYLK